MTRRLGWWVAPACAALVASGGCTDKQAARPPAPLPVSEAAAPVCDVVPRAAAELIAGSGSLHTDGTLTAGSVGSCGIYRDSARKDLVLTVSVLVSPQQRAAAVAFAAMSHTLDKGSYRLPPTEGYGFVGKGGNGVEGRNGFGITASGLVKISVAIVDDAPGRDPVADSRALLNILGPKLAPEWPAAPQGIDPLKPTSPPPGLDALVSGSPSPSN